MITTPGAYAAWLSWCDAFGRGEDLPTGHLTPLDEQAGPEMVERVLSHLVAAYHQRTRRWAEDFKRDFQRIDRASTQGVAQVLTLARSRLAPLARLTRSELITVQARTEFGTALAETVTGLQDELERSVRRDPRVERTMLPTIQQYPLTLGLTSESIEAHVQRTGPASSLRRRVIL